MIVLDTHAWWWMVMSPEKLSTRARQTMEGSGKLRIAAVSLIEIVMLQHKGRIINRMPWVEWFDLALTQSCVGVLPLDARVAVESYALPGEFHKDPADRQIVATARLCGSMLVTKDQRIVNYPHVKTVW